MSKDKVNTSLRLEREQLKELKRIALERDSSVQKILEQLVKDFLKEQKKQ